MQDGLYRVHFRTPLGEGFGVISLQGGSLKGGDSMMYYVGTYSEDGNSFTAQVDVDVHSRVPGMQSVLGATKAKLSLKGTSTETSANVTGSSPQSPGIGFSAALSKLPG